MTPDGKPYVFRLIGYRGYLLSIMSDGRVRISTMGDADVICTEASRIEAEHVVDGWVANKGQS